MKSKNINLFRVEYCYLLLTKETNNYLIGVSKRLDIIYPCTEKASKLDGCCTSFEGNRQGFA